MRYVEIQGVRVPALGFGTWALTAENTRLSVLRALQAGYRHVDTAQAYDNEEHVGAALREAKIPRSEIFLTTKLHMETQRYDEAKRSLEISLEKLGTDYVDLFLIHWPSSSVPLEETMRALNELQAKGMTRHIGVSNFPSATIAKARALAATPLFANQVEYHALLSQNVLLEDARANGAMLTAYSPLARGKIVSEPTLGEIGKRYGKSAAQVGLRWLIQQVGVSAIPRSSNPERIRTNFEIFDFELDDGEMARIWTLPKDQRVVRPPWAPVWDPEPASSFQR
ncbi:MAG: aldo/keto reductase [Candidatus Eremiobacteraeota bacterium]|nr:aldo/keto reductase [Candidatus Eremiobacteraeota bacterium]